MTGEGDRIRLVNADCREYLATLPDNSIDSCVVDPPYGLGKVPDPRELLTAWLAGEDYEATGGGFMGQSWDAFVPGPGLWSEVARVLKPGAHAVVFAGQRTADVMGIALRLGGFEIRDLGGWQYWSGFPKSLNVSKAIDRVRDDYADCLKVTTWFRAARDAAGLSNSEMEAPFGFSGMAGHWVARSSQPTVPTLDQLPVLFDVLGAEPPAEIRDLIWRLNGRKHQPGDDWFDRDVTGVHDGPAPIQRSPLFFQQGGFEKQAARDKPKTPDAIKWQGWGTALKPCLEPWILARVPFAGTVADNVKRWGTGAINVDACRYGYGDPAWPGPNGDCSAAWEGKGGVSTNIGARDGAYITTGEQHRVDLSGYKSDGRWPANVYVCPKASTAEREAGCEGLRQRTAGELTGGRAEGSAGLDNPRAGAGRTSEGRGNCHPTVKPIKLIRWLQRLTTPRGGLTLDPFCGSGTSLIAAHLEGFRAVGCELSADYCDIARARLKKYTRQGLLDLW